LYISPDDTRRVATLLGREPRGLRAIACAHADGSPIVIQVASLVNDKPFPTLFWLVDPALRYRIDQAEAGGLIARLQARVDANRVLRAAMAADHRAHMRLRDSYLDADQRRRVEQLGYGGALRHRGIGGIADFGRIRCLHAWYAAHLVVPNTVGRLLDAGCRAASRTG